MGHNDIGRDNCCLIEERTRSLIEKQKGELNIVGAMVGNPNMAGSQGNNKSSEMTTIFIYKKLNMYFFFGWSLFFFFSEQKLDWQLCLCGSFIPVGNEL